MEKIKVGVIGAGKIGQIHINNIYNSDSYQLKTIVDPYIDPLIAEQYKARGSMIAHDPNEIFEDEELQAIFICSLTETHADYIIKAANKGKHVFCEKPLSLNIDESIKALKAVQENNVKLQIGFNRRFDKHFGEIKEQVVKGTIGEPHLIKISSRDPQPPPEEYVRKSGGMFIDMTIHDFDMVRFLSGCEVEDVTVKAHNLVDPMFGKYNDVDTAVLVLTLENDAIAVIDNSRQAVYGYDQRIEVFGSQGAVETSNETETNIKILTKDHVKLDQPKFFFLERYEEAYKNEIVAFAKSIKEEKEVSSSGIDGIKAEVLAIAAQKSLEENRTVRIDELGVSKILSQENINLN